MKQYLLALAGVTLGVGLAVAAQTKPPEPTRLIRAVDIGGGSLQRLCHEMCVMPAPSPKPPFEKTSTAGAAARE